MNSITSFPGLIAGCLCLISCAGSSESPAARAQMQGRPVFGAHSGITYAGVLERYGKPQGNFVQPAAEFGGELYTKLQHRFRDAPQTPVRQLYYSFGDRYSYFWLTRTNGTWRVIDDVAAPSGIQF